MADGVTFAPAPTGSEAPAAPEAQLTGEAKALADTKAELTRVQQELAALKKDPAQAAPEAPAASPTPEPAPASDPSQAAQQAVAAAGLDVSSWQSEFDTTGDVSEDGRAKIAEALKAQFGEQARAVVDQFIDGRKSALAARDAELYAAAGGKEGYGEMATWAKAALTEAEIGQYNAALNSGDTQAALLAIKGLRARYEGANGRDPQLIGGSATPAASAGFRSVDEMKRAMSDPRYKSDPAFRADVEKRVAGASFW